jgi:transcriptional regulator with AbiEi antitoxin domain of type IV toxin-antitoxin system
MDDLDANWVDEVGHARVATTSGLLVLRETAQSRARSVAELKWTPSQADVAEAILAQGRVPSVRDIANQTEWSLQPVSAALRLFDRQGWTRKVGTSRGRGSKRSLANGNGLLDVWAEHASRETSESLLAHTSMRDPLAYLRSELAPRLEKLGDYAVSGWAGVQLVMPMLTVVPTLQIYVEASIYDELLPRLITEMGIRRVEQGARLEFRRARAAALLRPQRARAAPVSVAHAARLYSDLLTLGDRGRDAAERLRIELLTFSNTMNAPQMPVV